MADPVCVLGGDCPSLCWASRGLLLRPDERADRQRAREGRRAAVGHRRAGRVLVRAAHHGHARQPQPGGYRRGVGRQAHRCDPPARSANPDHRRRDPLGPRLAQRQADLLQPPGPPAPGFRQHHQRQRDWKMPFVCRLDQRRQHVGVEVGDPHRLLRVDHQLFGDPDFA